MKQDIPHNRADVLDGSNRFTRDWYDYLRRIKPVSAPTNVQQTVINNSQFLPPVTSAVGYEEGTSFPPTPASGDKFYRTDLNWLCFYDGTRWLTCHEYTETLGMQAVNLPATTTPFAVAYLATRRDYQLYILRFTLHPFVATTNNGGNYWTIDARWANSANVQTSLGTSNTSAGAANTNLDGSITINAPLNTGSFYIEIQATKTGTPGSFYLWGSMSYRLIVT